MFGVASKVGDQLFQGRSTTSSPSAAAQQQQQQQRQQQPQQTQVENGLPTPRSPRSARSVGSGDGVSARSQRSGGSGQQQRSARTPGARSLFSGTSSAPSAAARKLTRNQILRQLREPEETGALARLRAKLRTQLGQGEEEEGATFKDSGDEEEDDDDEFKDVADELCLTVEPQVEELGEPAILDLKRSGKLNVDDDDIIQRFKRHKARQGKAMFEAENANNLGVEYFGFGDMVGALAYFKRALESCSKETKPAAQELAEFKDFIKQQYDGDLQAFYTALSDGEWRLALGRRRFVTVMKKVSYPGDPDRLFSMLDFCSKDGKATMTEVDALLQTKGARLSRMDNDSIQKGVILNNIGACHLQQGNYIVGLQRLREASKIIQQASENVDDDSVVHRVMSNIAVAYINLGDIDAAINFISRVLNRREATSGVLESDALNALYLSGYCFLVKANRFDIIYDQKRMDDRKQENAIEVNYNLAQCAFKERLRRQQLALDGISNAIDGEEVEIGRVEQLRLDVSRSHEIIAEIHDKRRELDRAIPHLRKAVSHKEAILSESDPEMLSSWNILASVCMRSGLFEEALEVMEKAISASIVLFGETSLAVATEVLHVGLILFRMASQQIGAGDRELAAGSFQLAVEKLTEAKEVQAELLGDEDEEFASTVQLLGSVYLAAGQRREARRHFEQALLIRVALLGRADVATASSAHALGTLYARMPRRQKEALQLLRKASLIRERRLGGESLYLAESLHELGSVLLRQRNRRDHELALQHLSRAAKIRERKLGKESLKYASSLHQVGQAHAHLGLFGEARLYLQAALALRERLTSKRSAQVAMSRFALGVTLYNLGELGSAMKELRGAYVARESMYGTEHAQSADCLHQIGVVHFKGGEPQAALPFMLRALEIRKRLNAVDVAAREEDSDEDPRDLLRRASARDKRIQRMRELSRKEQTREEKHRKIAERRIQEENNREKRRSGVERQKLKSAAQADNKKGMRSSKYFTGVFKSLRSKSGAWSSQGESDAGVSSSSPRSPQSSEQEGSDSDAGSDGSDGIRNHNASPRDRDKHGKRQSPGRNLTGGFPVQGEPKNKTDAATPSGSDQAGDDSDDSNVCLDDIGVDIRGWLAGAIGSSMLTLAIVYMEIKDHRAARMYLRSAICIREEVFGSVSTEHGEALHVYGVLNQKQDQLVIALRYFRDALHVREKASGHAHESTAASCIAMGEVLVSLGHGEDANIYLLRGINIRESLFGPEDAVVKGLKDKWGKLMAAWMQYDPVKQGEALPHFSRRSPESFLHGFAHREETRGQSAAASGATT